MQKQTRKAMGAFASGRCRSEFNLVFEDFMRSLGGSVAEGAFTVTTNATENEKRGEQ